MDFYNVLSNEWRPSQNISGIKVSSVTWTQHGVSKSCSDTQRTEGYIDAASYVSAAFLNPALVVLAGCLSRPVRRLLARCLPELTAAAAAAARRLTEGSVRLGRSPSAMGGIILPRRMFLWCMAVIYLAAFVSLYVQIPGEPRTSCHYLLVGLIY